MEGCIVTFTVIKTTDNNDSVRTDTVFVNLFVHIVEFNCLDDNVLTMYIDAVV